MPKEKLPLSECLAKVEHHLSSERIAQYQLDFRSDTVGFWLSIVRQGIAESRKQVEKIREIAQGKGYQDILEILKEEIKFGHDFAERVADRDEDPEH